MCMSISMSVYIPVLFPGMDFIFHAMRNWLKKLLIPHMIKYTIGWEFDGREPPLIWEMYGY